MFLRVIAIQVIVDACIIVNYKRFVNLPIESARLDQLLKFTEDGNNISF